MFSVFGLYKTYSFNGFTKAEYNVGYSNSFKTKKERINEQLKTIQKDITENLKNINFKILWPESKNQITEK